MTTNLMVENHKPALDSLNMLSAKEHARAVDSFDFSDMYTVLKHDLVLDAINSTVIKVLGNKVMQKRARLDKASYGVKSFLKCVDAGFVINALKLLLNSSFFVFRNMTIKQAIGVPMGGAASGILANLTLHRLESKFINLAISYQTTYRYLDDILALNNGQLFEKFKNEIYPDSLTLNKTNQESTSSEFLDVNIEVRNNKFKLDIYDKTRAFSFKVIKLPHADSLIPSHIITNAVIGEIRRAAEVCITFTGLRIEVEKMLIALKKSNAIDLIR